MIAVFYGFEKMNFKVPVLSEMGKNMLLLFILAFVFDVAIGLFDRSFYMANPLITMLLVGVLPIVIEAGIALLLAKRDIKIKI